MPSPISTVPALEMIIIVLFPLNLKSYESKRVILQCEEGDARDQDGGLCDLHASGGRIPPGHLLCVIACLPTRR
jgi:hypothetical protein